MWKWSGRVRWVGGCHGSFLARRADWHRSPRDTPRRGGRTVWLGRLKVMQPIKDPHGPRRASFWELASGRIAARNIESLEGCT